jgi:hypothetical protein
MFLAIQFPFKKKNIRFQKFLLENAFSNSLFSLSRRTDPESLLFLIVQTALTELKCIVSLGFRYTTTNIGISLGTGVVEVGVESAVVDVRSVEVDVTYTTLDSALKL